MDTDTRPPASLWREPLVHFLAIGAVLFLLHRLLNSGDSSAPREIVVSEARTEALAENFAKTWMRPPTAQEMTGLVDDYVAEEIYYREAIAMGLDRDDTVIRRRLRQKMEFISEDVATSAPPSDAQLQVFVDQHAGEFLQPARLTFEQVFFSLERRGKAAREASERMLAQLSEGRGLAAVQDGGDPTLLPPGLQSATPQDIANVYGIEFARFADRAPVGQWTGPVQSDFGLHLIRVGRREPARSPALAEIRPVVQREWEADQRRKVNDTLLASLRSKYDVRIEGSYGELIKSPRQTSPIEAPK